MSDCIFCKIANGEIPSTTLYEDDLMRVIFDISPAAAGHALIMPKAHAANIIEADPDTVAAMFKEAQTLAGLMMEKLDCQGVNVIVNTGAAAGQTVDHFHIHLIPRYADNPALDGLHISQDEIETPDFEELKNLLAH